MFRLTKQKIDENLLQRDFFCPSSGARVVFAGIVRNHHKGRKVQGIDYEVYPELALSEGNRILGEAKTEFDLQRAEAVHRYGPLSVLDTAVWVGVLSVHRKEAYAASQYIMAAIKARLPIWKRERYSDGSYAWVACREQETAGR